MGACGSALLERLGPEFGKFVAVQKGKDYLTVKLNQLKNTISSQSSQIKNQAFSQVDEQQKVVTNKLNQTIGQIEKTAPGTLDKAAMIQRKSKEQLLGSSKIKQSFQDLKSKIQQQFDKQLSNVHEQINTQGQEIKKKLDAQRVQIPVYDQLPESQKKKVFEQGEKKFGPLIQQHQQEVQKQIEKSLNMDKYLDTFKSLQSSINPEGITKELSSVIQTSKTGLSVTSMCC